MKSFALAVAISLTTLAAPGIVHAQEAPTVAPHWVNVPLPPQRPVKVIAHRASKVAKTPLALNNNVVISAGTGF